jgi:hypothetical protein
MQATRFFPFLTAFCFFIVMQGCGPSLREQALADFNNQVKSIKTVGVVSPDMLIYELSAGGVRELMYEWCETARGNFSNAVADELNTRSVGSRPIDFDHDKDADLEEMYYLNRAISESLQWNTTYRKLALCADERTCPDYSFGPVEPLLKKYKVDALLMVWGQGEQETSGRASARRRSRAISILSGFGYVRIAPIRNPGTYVSMALIDRSGSVLWYTSTRSGKGYDLRDQAKVKELTRRMLSRLWAEERE